MAYETKALLTLLYKYARKADSVEEICEIIRDVANSEGIVIPPSVPTEKQETVLNDSREVV